MCVRACVRSSARHGKYGAFHSLAHAQIIICLPHTDTHTHNSLTHIQMVTCINGSYPCTHAHIRTFTHVCLWVRAAVQQGGFLHLQKKREVTFFFNPLWFKGARKEIQHVCFFKTEIKLHDYFVLQRTDLLSHVACPQRKDYLLNDSEPPLLNSLNLLNHHSSLADNTDQQALNRNPH